MFLLVLPLQSVQGKGYKLLCSLGIVVSVVGLLPCRAGAFALGFILGIFVVETLLSFGFTSSYSAPLVKVGRLLFVGVFCPALSSPKGWGVLVLFPFSECLFCRLGATAYPLQAWRVCPAWYIFVLVVASLCCMLFNRPRLSKVGAVAVCWCLLVSLLGCWSNVYPCLFKS